MSGDANRQGLRFQDRYLLLLLLREIGATLEQRFVGSVRPSAVAKCFGVEARPRWLRAPGTRGPAWDVIAQGPHELEIVEVKSGRIRRSDRQALWRRLRRELSFSPASDLSLIPVLAADPERAGNLALWEQMAELAAGGPAVPPRIAPREVRRPSHLLDEALWHLCTSRSGQAPPVPRDAALAALARLRVDRHVDAELTEAVARGVELIFTTGLTEQIEDTILGWLGRRAVDDDQARRFLTVEDLLREMQVFEAATSLAPAMLETWRNLWEELPAIFADLARESLGRDSQAIEPGRTQPVVDSRLADGGSHLLVGQAGTGKTGMLRQRADRERLNGSEVFTVAADSVTGTGQLEDLFKTLRFKRALAFLRTPERVFWLGVDGLDEVNNETLQRRWAQHLAQFQVRRRTTVVATVRASAWEQGGVLRPHLDSFTVLSMEDWSEELVRELLADIPGATRVSSGLLELLRRPLFLDLFCRTYAEGGLDAIPAIESRQDIFREFWINRVLRSRRPKPADFPLRLDEVLSAGVQHVGGFDSAPLDQQTVGLLVSEGVLVPEGGHAFRHRFRHPLLRDHVFCLWCLEADASRGLVGRWQRILGGLPARGTLRLIFEALRAADAETRHPRVELGEVIAALSEQSDHARSMARMLGTLPPTPSTNPASLPADTQARLPAEFGRELISAARSARNGGWAQAILSWSADAEWIDEGFLATLHGYAEVLVQLSNHRVLQNATEQDSAELDALRQARMVADTLRSFSRHDRFAAALAQHRRHLQGAILELVIKLVPDDETFDMVERELPVATNRTCEMILKEFFHLAAHDHMRAAELFRRLVGLGRNGGRPTLDPARWQSLMLEQPVFDGVFGGNRGRPSALAEHPREFMPLALEFAEALAGVDYPLPGGCSLWDDLLHWHNFWNREHRHRSFDRCLRAIRQACGRIVAANPNLFLGEVMPMLRRSASAAVQSICLDTLLEHIGDAGCSAESRASLFDARLYRVPLLLHWLEEALRRYWETFNAQERVEVLTLIDEMAAGSALDSGASQRRAQMLATIPAHELIDARLRELAAPRSVDYVPTPHPSTSPYVRLRGEGWIERNPDPDEHRIADWPPEFAADALLVLSAGGRRLADRDVTPETVRDYLPQMVAAASGLLEAFEAHPDVLTQPRRFWMWHALALCVDKLGFEQFGVDAPSVELVAELARLALGFLEREMPSVDSDPTDSWERALRLANAALVWPSLPEGETLQRRFEQVWRQAFAAGSTAVQVAVTRGVSRFHWTRSAARQQLDDELIWMAARRDAVLAAAIDRLDDLDGRRQVRFLRRILGHNPEGSGGGLAGKLGLWMGQEAMGVTPTRGRSAIVSTIDEVLRSPRRWALLETAPARRAFLHQFALGMQRLAGLLWPQARRLAADYGRWSIAVWRGMQAAEPTNEERELASILLFWLPQDAARTSDDPSATPRDSCVLRVWWSELQPFCLNIAEEGTHDDIWQLAENMRPGLLSHVLQAGEVLRWVEALLQRMDHGLACDAQFLERPAGEQRQMDWREVLRVVVNALDGLRTDHLLQSEHHRDISFRFLNRLGSPPYRIESALHAMQQFE